MFQVQALPQSSTILSKKRLNYILINYGTTPPFSEPVQLIAFVLQQGGDWNPLFLEALRSTWGPIRLWVNCTPLIRLIITNRRWVRIFFGRCFLLNAFPEKIGEEKRISNDLEKLSTQEIGGRDINIDIGYMDLDKVVLPSFKQRAI